MSEAAPTLHLELLERRPSGFILDGSKGTMNEIELNAPNKFWVPNSGFMCEIQEQEVTVAGVKEKRQVKVNVPIRYIKNCNEIREVEQKKMGITPAFDKSEDMIVFDRSYANLAREGSGIALYDYLSNVFYNDQAPDRPITADPLFTVVRIDERANQIADDDEALVDAMKFILELREKVGKEYIFNEERIDTYCKALNTFADSYPQKFYSLMQITKANPKMVVSLLSKLEQITLTEINHALQLDVLVFVNNTAQLKNPEKIIFSAGTGRHTQEKLQGKLADYLKSPEGGSDYAELKARIEIAKENKMKAQ